MRSIGSYVSSVLDPLTLVVKEAKRNQKINICSARNTQYVM